MQIKRFLLIFVLITVIISAFGSATFTVDTNKSVIKKSYNQGDIISGIVYVKFNNQSSESLLSANLGSKKVSLIDWLKNNGKKEVVDYNCSFKGCMPNYQSIGEINSVDISIQQPKMIGFKISGTNVSIRSLAFSASSSLATSCTKQFSINILDNPNKILQNYRYTDQLCGNPSKGCFDSNLNAENYLFANLTNTPYCEIMSLNPAPAYLFSSNLTKQGNRNEEISYDLYSADFTTIYGSCTAGTDSKCTINYTVTKSGDYGICISSNETNSAYQIRAEQDQSRLICGSANLGQTKTIDFDITAQAKEYAAGEVYFDWDKYAMLNNEENLTSSINSYLSEEYNSDCASQECFIPFNVVGENQKITFSNPLLIYESAGVVLTQNKLSEIKKTDSIISSGILGLSLDQTGINITNKNSILQINLENSTLIKTNVEVSSIPISIEPGFGLIGVSTEFKIKTNLSITSATWKFGDDGSTASGSSVRHTFSKQGTYTVEVNAITTNGSFSKTQQITVGEPKPSAEELFSVSQSNLGNLANKIKTVPANILPGIAKKIDVIKLNNSLMQIKDKLDYASNDSEYLQIIQEIQSLQIPESFGITRSGSFPMIAAYQNINVVYLDALYDQEQSNSDQIKKSILDWTRDNYNGNIELTTYGIGTEEGNAPLITKVKIMLTPIGSSTGEKFLVVDYPIESINFLGSYSQKEIQSGTYMPVQGETTIEFYLEGETTIDNLGVYIAPALSELQKQGYSYEVLPSSGDRARKIIYTSLIILIVILIMIAIPLQYWYRNSYEKYLFPKQESLFNVMTFIYNSKKASLKEGDIRRNLLSNGWTREQISYALGKFEGKIFGLFGLPIYSARKEKEVKTIIEDRQRQIGSRKVY